MGCIVCKQGPVAARLGTALGMSVRSMAEVGKGRKGVGGRYSGLKRGIEVGLM